MGALSRDLQGGYGPFGRRREPRLTRCVGVQDERRAGEPYGAGRLRRELRFRIEGVLARRLGVMPESAALPDPAPSGTTSRCSGGCRLVGCGHDR